MTQSKKEHPTYTKGPVSKIGETGGTVVYIFPGGKACVKKGEKGKKNEKGEKASSALNEPKIATAKNQRPKVKTVPMSTVKSSPTVKKQVSSPSPLSTQTIKRVGDRLVDAGIINPTQLQVALYDQKAMKLRLGDVLIARGWVDQSTLDAVLTD